MPVSDVVDDKPPQLGPKTARPKPAQPALDHRQQFATGTGNPRCTMHIHLCETCHAQRNHEPSLNEVVLMEQWTGRRGHPHSGIPNTTRFHVPEFEELPALVMIAKDAAEALGQPSHL